MALINAPVSNIYAQPDETSEVISQCLYGWQIKVIEEYLDFKKIQLVNSYQGWISTKDLYFNSISKAPSIRAKTIHNRVHLYHQPDVTKQKPLMTLPYEIYLDVIAEPEDEDFRWLQVQLVAERSAWIQRRDVILNPPLLTLSQVLQLSQQFLGLPYTWGGVSSFGYDCSGFTQMLFRQMGIFLTHNSRQQLADPLCQEIEWHDLQAGDLVFFGSSKEAIIHVGFYLGEEKVIHATARPVPILQIHLLEDPSLKQRFAYRTARRICVPRHI